MTGACRASLTGITGTSSGRASGCHDGSYRFWEWTEAKTAIRWPHHERSLRDREGANKFVSVGTHPNARGSGASSRLLKNVLERSGCARLIQHSGPWRTKDSAPRGPGFENCASLIPSRVFQQPAKALGRHAIFDDPCCLNFRRSPSPFGHGAGVAYACGQGIVRTGEAAMAKVLNEILLFSSMAVFVTGIVLAAARLLI